MVATGTGAAGSGYTARIITTPDEDLAEDKVVTVTGSNSATATLTASGAWVMQMVTFSAASGPVPTVSSVCPNSGSTAGGTAVTITGTNFVAGATVTFGGNAATNVVVVSSTSITATTPAGSAGAVTVTVTILAGRTAAWPMVSPMCVGPTVSSVSPNIGPVAGGTAVTITGTNFAAGATVNVWRDSSDQCGGGEQHLDYGDDAGGQRGSSDGDGDQSGWAERQPGQRVHLHCRRPR